MRHWLAEMSVFSCLEKQQWSEKSIQLTSITILHLVATDVTSVIMKNFFSVVKYHSIYFLLVKHSHVFILKIALTISLLYYVVILFYKRSILCMNSMLSELIGRFSSYLLNFSALIVAKWQYPHPTPPIPPPTPFPVT